MFFLIIAYYKNNSYQSFSRQTNFMFQRIGFSLRHAHILLQPLLRHALRSVLTSESQQAILPFNKNLHKILTLLDPPLSADRSLVAFGAYFRNIDRNWVLILQIYSLLIFQYAFLHFCNDM